MTTPTRTGVSGKPRSLIDLLARLPEEELARMRQLNQHELARARGTLERLEIEKTQLDEAAALRSETHRAERGRQ